MLVAGVGATWWFRSQAHKANYQVAMAPTAGEGGGKTAQQLSEQKPRVARTSDARSGVGQSAITERKLAPTGETAPAGQPEPVQAPKAVQPIEPQKPVLEDREASHAIQTPPRPVVSNGALARRESDEMPSPARPEPLRSVSDRTLDRARTNHAAAPGGPALFSSPAAAPQLSAPEAAAPGSVSAGAPARTGLAAVDRNHDRNATALAFGGAESTSGARATTQLRVTVQETRQVSQIGQQLRALAGRHSELVVQSSDGPTIFASMVPGSQDVLAEAIVRLPGVVRVESRELPVGDPLARRASWLAAQQQWQQAARDFVAWAASGQPAGPAPVRDTDWSVYLTEVPSIVPREASAALVIVLQSAEALAPGSNE